MSTYLIGDVQGCWLSLQALLNHINYDSSKDQLGFVGDLLNRGNDSLATLRFIHQLKDPLVVLGNHDIYSLILFHEHMSRDAYKHTLDELFQADDADTLMAWLSQQAIMITLPEHNAVMVHAGIAPQWSLEEAQTITDEFTAVMRSADSHTFLNVCEGNEPASWSNNLTDHDRTRYIVNAFTRMRFCDANGSLDLKTHIATHQSPDIMKPWFDYRHNDKLDIMFGHWASLNKPRPREHCYALDSGCAWGHTLTALRLEDRNIFSVPSAEK